MIREHASRAVSLVLAVLLMALVLAFGGDLSGSGLEVGDEASRDFYAEQEADVLDPVATAAAQERALADFEEIYEPVEETEAAIEESIEDIFAFAAANALADPQPLPGLSFSTPTTSTTTADSTTTSTTATTVGDGDAPPTTITPVPIDPVVADATLVGRVFIDVESDGAFDPEAGRFGVSDTGAVGIVVVARVDGADFETETDDGGFWELAVPSGDIEVGVDPSAGGFPANFVYSTDNSIQEITCREDAECQVGDVGLAPNVRALDRQVFLLREEYAFLGDETLATLAEMATGDVVRAALDIDLRMEAVASTTIQRARDVFEGGIRDSDELDREKNNVVRNPPFVLLEDGTRDDDASAAAGHVLASQLQITQRVDVEATEQKRSEILVEVEDEYRTIMPEALIVRAGEELTEFHLEAIDKTGALTGRTLRRAALVGILVVLVSSLGFYLARFRPQFWHAPRMVALWATLLVLGAAAVRLAIALEPRTGTFYVLPAVAFGYLAAVLFDNRMGTLMALTMAMLAAVGTEQASVSVFALLATLAPIGFVSKVSTRRAFRNSVLVSSVAVAVIAAAVTWFFDTGIDDSLWDTVGIGTLWAFSSALVASLVALAAMPFFESVFDITTTLRLLELTDRNHEALQLIQEKAFGTFNHSLMVGTLADSAARAIGANNLLARAAAYYHDIGKTENPTYFIENQFGISNPHDDLPPEESAEIIRAHVTEGIALAVRYKIPSEVSEGILAHHGDAIMRYFYEKARQSYGESAVDPDRYRHAGHKPRSREMAIVMMADSVEGACRAVFADEEPTAETIAKVVNRVVDEKMGDGQLGDSDLTLAELTKVRNAFIDALVGHYHQRIQYPNFPGS